MPFKTHRLSLVLLAGCVLFTAISLQNLPGQNAQKTPRTESQLPPRVSDQTYRISVDLVNVLCSVFDKDTNSFVTNLMRDDFAVYEDGKKQEIKNFARETNLPLTIAMLIDTSDSVAPKLKFEQEAAISFFQSVLRDKDRALLVEFDTGVTLLQDFTGDPNKLAKEIRKLRAAGGTALYDAIYMACDEKLIRETGRKAIVIVSDGDDESSNATLHQAIEMALRAETTVFVISITKGGFFGVQGSPEGDAAMKEITRETGGKLFFPFKLEELEDAFRQINQELRSQYSLGYYSTNTARDGSYRKIEVKISEKNLKPSHRKGYYAPNS
ncbi:MAG TPA: VWA domain-containing protein [Acidobacteriota bacterium]|nr:VWA domain-containing protein [Acidobacteriota bacterium]